VFAALLGCFFTALWLIIIVISIQYDFFAVVYFDKFREGWVEVVALAVALPITVIGAYAVWKDGNK
jgi:hypothetical protein